MNANWPFFIAIIVFMFILMGVPELATWLPAQMRD
jgi:TRAP-type C4-dicarboxylate transport system permease large subunit